MPHSKLPRWPIGVVIVIAAVAATQLGRFPTSAAGAPQTAPARVPPPSPSDALFDDRTLHDVWLRMSDEDWQRLRTNFQNNTYYRVEFEWRNHRVAGVGIRSRGGATRNDSKPGLQVDFNRYVDGQEFLGLKALVLDNHWHDPSMIKERVSMLLFKRLQLPAPREAHARLYIGPRRDYAGLYAIVENIDERFLERTYGTDDGYLHEFERVDGQDYRFEDLGDGLAAYAERFEPETHDDEPDEVLFAPIRALVRAVNRATPAELERAVAPHLNFDAFLTRVALENYLAQWDGLLGDVGMANFYLYRPADSLRFETIAWDQDNTFTSLDFPPWYNVHQNVLMRKVWADDRLRERYLQQLLRVATAADGWLVKEIRRQYDQIRPAVLVDPWKYRTNAEFEEAIAFMTRFARERSAGVRKFVDTVRAYPEPENLGK